MLTWGYDQTTRLWDKSGQPLRTIYGPVTNAQFSPDGQSILIFDENEKSMQHWEGLPQYIRSHTQLGAGDLLQAGAILDPKLLLEQQTPVELAEIGEVYLQRKDWAKAHLFYTTANQRKQSPEATIGLYKVAKQSRKTFDFKQFLAAEDATTLRQYGDFLYETAVLPSYHADEKRPYDTTLVPIVVQLYEKAERQAHSSETLIRLHVIALKKGQEFDLQRFFQAKNAKELRQYGNYLFDVSGLTNHDFALNADNRLLLQTAAQLYEKTEQVEHSVETLIRLYKIARKTGQTFDLQRFLATKNPSELAEYGNYFFTTAYQEKVPQTLPIEYNQWNTNPNEIRSKYDKSPLGPNEPSRTLLQFATQLYEKSEQLKHSAETLIRLHLMAEMTEQPFDFQRFLATDDVEELRQYADYLMSFQFPNYTTNIPYAQQAIRLGEKMLVLAAGTRQKMALARYYNWLGFCQLFIPDGAAAEISLRRALALDSTLLNLPIHLAHAQLLQGRYLDAEKFYLEYKDKPFKYRDYKTYFLGDFQTLEAQGVSHPDIARIRARLEDRKE